MASNAIPVTKAVAEKNAGIPDNGFTNFTGVGAAHDEVDYASIPKIETNGQWLFVFLQNYHFLVTMRLLRISIFHFPKKKR